MIKILKANENGKIEFTEDELKKLLEESYDEGYKDGYGAGKVTYPYYPNTTPINPSYPPGW